MSGSTSWPLQGWFAVALVRDVRTRPLRRVLQDTPIVLARGSDGGLMAMHDRCPHRQAPLSAGHVVDGTLQCRYHGWRFAADGRLAALPGLPAGCPLPGIRAHALPVREHDGIVWVRPHGDGDTLPAIATGLDGHGRRFLWSTRWNASLLDAIENVLDATHTHTVHAGLVRRAGARRPIEAELRAHDRGFRVDYRGAATQSGLIHRLFEPPRVLETAHFELPASVQFEYGYIDGSNLRISLHFAPETADSTALHVAFHVLGRRAPAWAVRAFVWPLLRRVAMQDAAMLALLTANRRQFAGMRDAVGPLDVVRIRLEAFLRGTPTEAGSVAERVQLNL